MHINDLFRNECFDPQHPMGAGSFGTFVCSFVCDLEIEYISLLLLIS